MKTAKTAQLTADQAADVRLARQALADSEADTGPAHDLKHRASLEYHVAQLLEIITGQHGNQD